MRATQSILSSRRKTARTMATTCTSRKELTAYGAYSHFEKTHRRGAAWVGGCSLRRPPGEDRLARHRFVSRLGHRRRDRRADRGRGGGSHMAHIAPAVEFGGRVGRTSDKTGR